MSIPAAYAAVIVIWSTTPLAVKLSGEGVGFLFGVTSRMAIGTLLSLLVLKLMKIRLPLDRAAHVTYSASAIGIFGAMLCVYWSAQYIPSGMISVIFAIAPLMTGLLESKVLQKKTFSPLKILGFGIGFTGIALVFHEGLSIGTKTWMGILGMLMSVTMFSISGILVKKYGKDMSPLAANCGGLIYGSTLFLVMWFVVGGQLPQLIPAKAMASILYLGVIGTVIGFTLYMYLLKHQSPSTLSLITLVTPVLALLIGHQLNHENIGSSVWIGTGLIMMGLVLHQEPNRLLEKLKADKYVR